MAGDNCRLQLSEAASNARELSMPVGDHQRELRQ